ncbi:MAG: NADH-quinone oxidoreductase subunit A [Candidatus Bathyarchaeia archaeon]
MIYIGDHIAFWLFTFIELGFLSIAILISRLIGPVKPNKTKETIYECGQPPFSPADEFRLLGITRYFGYAVVFFALDAFAWVLLTAAISIHFDLKMIAIVSFYVLVVLIGISYFLIEHKKMVG